MKYFTEADLKNLCGKDTSLIKPAPSAELLDRTQKRLGVKLPESYIELAAEVQNGISLEKRCAVPVVDSSGNVIRYVKSSYITNISHEQGDKSYPENSWYYNDRVSPELFYDRPNLIRLGSDFSNNSYETFVMNYLDCGSEGEPTIALIDRKVRRGKASEPTLGSDDWRNINDDFYLELTPIAPNFETYIKSLVPMPKLLAFDFGAIKEPLKQAAKKSFRELVKVHGKESIVAFGLYIDSEGSMIADAANTYSHLEKHLTEFPKEKDYYTYYTTEWHYEGLHFALDLFEPICAELSAYSAALGTDDKIKRFRDKLLDACAEILAELKNENFFANEYTNPVVLSVNISNDNISGAKRKKLRAILE